ncbi:MAG TPA: RNA polymerase sigma factor RpoD/SigA [Phycisphaerae bacterium]|nr:RNA polymerase sigma factor RpoD/SigA [Phycisphaerae bacterium]HRY68557.1 RNA polymerase sigma factor RpoD/SigA [Phycisphaerae bacterium]HSA25605.1 RNA polymerase sigma factor RpoD/SigA [Phycisphaerae bacterium]
MQHYLKQIDEAPLLTAQEEQELGRAIQYALKVPALFQQHEITLKQKEEAELTAARARDRMILSNLRLVVNIAKNYLNRGLALADLIEEGNIGLLRGVEGYDPTMETRFSTYASWWIKQAIKRALINSVQPVHIPAYMVAMIADWKKALTELEQKHGKQPTLQEMARHMNLTERKVRIIRRAVKAFSAPTQSGSADGSFGLNELLADQKTPSPQDSAFSNADAEVISKLLSKIDEREATILKLRYGLDNQEPMTLKQIGVKVGLTRERVRQLEREALVKLREALNEM